MQSAVPISPAVVAWVRQLAAQAEHRRAIAEFRARRAAREECTKRGEVLVDLGGEASAAAARPAWRRRPRPMSADLDGCRR
jgi:hypothetical protein